MLLAAATAAACTMSPARMLDAYRAASSAASELHGTLISQYLYKSAGLTGHARVTVDLGDGRYIKEQQAGIVAESEGFDGRVPWARDMSSFAKPEEAGDLVALAVNQAYRNANLWWRTDRGGASLASLGCNGVRITPKNGKPFEAWFDPVTHLLVRVREARTFGGVAETTFANFRRRTGLLVPTLIKTSHGSDQGSDEVLRLTAVSRQPSKSATDYSIPRHNPSDWSLPATGPVTLPFRLVNNHIIVGVTIDGHGPYPFLVDSGGHDILTPSTVAAAGLSPQGSASSAGAGEKIVRNGYVRVRRIDAGGAVLLNQPALTLDFSPPAVEGLQLGGMLGVEFLERFVVRIDYGRKTLTLINPTQFTTVDRARSGTLVPIRFYDHMPQVAGILDGRAARFNIDTGARDEITLTSPFVAKNNLKYAYPGGVEITTGWGVGGPSRTYAVRATSMSMGDVSVSKPVIALSSAKRGSFSDPSYEGNVGSGLLKRFVVTFDYSRRAMYLKPVSTPDPDIGRFDRSGMWLNLATTGFQIMDIVPGGPADIAGLAVGDVITAIDGVPFDKMSLSDTRQALRLAPLSKPITLQYRRGSIAAATALRPHDLISE